MSDREKIIEEMKPREHLGIWWIPSEDAPPHNVAGLMREENGSELSLKILGELLPGDSVDSFRKYPIVNGACHAQRRFTIVDATLVERHFDGGEDMALSESRIWCREAWCGKECYTREEDIAFVSYSAGMYGLAALHDARPFTTELKFAEHSATLSYRCPDEVQLYEDDNVKASIGYTWCGPNQSLGQVSADIAHDAQIIIKSKHGQIPFYGEAGSIDFYLMQLRTVLGLMTGLGAHLYECKGTIRQHTMPQDGNPFIPEIVLTRMWRREVPKLGGKDVSPLDVLLPLGVVGDVKPIVEGFFGLPKPVRDFAGHLVYLNGKDRSSLSQGALAELVYMFEGSHRELYGGDKMRLVLRFIDELQRTEKVFKNLSEDELGLSLAIYIKKRRDNYAHANPDSCYDEFRLFMFATYWMHYFLSAMYLVACGVSPEVIFNGFQRNFKFVQMYKELPTLIRQHRVKCPDELANFKAALSKKG